MNTPRKPLFVVIIFILITSLILTACGSPKAVITREDAVSSCAPRLVDSWNAITGEVKCQQVDVPASTTSEDPMCTNNDGGKYTAGQHEWINGDEYVCTADSQGNASFVPVVTTCTNACPTVPTPMEDAILCVATGGHEGWGNPELKSYEWSAVVSVKDLRKGFTLQPYFKMVTKIADILGFKVPEKTMPINDAVQTLTCQFNGKLYTWVFDRKGTTSTPFWKISAWKLNEDLSITIWTEDTGAEGSWEGIGAGESYTYNLTDAFTSWDAAISFVNEEAFTLRIKNAQELVGRLPAFNTISYMEIEGFWK